MRSLGFPGERIVGRRVHQVNVQPSIVVVVDQPHARARRFQDELLLWRPIAMRPLREPRLLGNIHKNGRAVIDESTRRNRPLLRIQNRGKRPARIYSSTRSLLWSLLWSLLRCAGW